MEFFFPDSQDLVDPSFDFTKETRSTTRLRQRDDLYAHEVFSPPPLNGILVSKAIVDGSGGAGGRYSIAQRHRLLRQGARSFFRLDRLEAQLDRPIMTMGDCGAFSYVREKDPPFTVEEVVAFYHDCGFDYGVSVDHIIMAYKPEWDEPAPPGEEAVPPEILERQKITLDLARDFLREHKRRNCRFTPVGVAQGWSPKSYAHSVEVLQDMGFERIAIGGLVPLKTKEILACLSATNEVRRPKTGFHLFGVTRTHEVSKFIDFGVVSFDSTSPLRQAFKDDKDNFWTLDRAPKTPTGWKNYTALRVPQVDGNPSLKRRIQAGEVNLAEACRLEKACLQALASFDRDEQGCDSVLDILMEYEALHASRRSSRDMRAAYEEVLTDRPWRNCDCEICSALRIHVIIFRGAERNRRRGFHNLFTFKRRLELELQGTSAHATPAALATR